jgi:hypothetical protein
VDDHAPDTVPNSGSREEGEIESGNKSGGEEDHANVDADPSELVAVKSVKSYPLAYVFGESKVTATLIKEYKEAKFFPIGDACPPSGEDIPAPEADEVVVLKYLFTCGLRFPCDPALPSILDNFRGKYVSLHRTPFWRFPSFSGS